MIIDEQNRAEEDVASIESLRRDATKRHRFARAILSPVFQAIAQAEAQNKAGAMVRIVAHTGPLRDARRDAAAVRPGNQAARTS